MRCVFASFALIVAVPAFAQDAQPDIKTGGDRVTIGAGPAVVPSYIGSNDHIVVPAVVLQGQVSGISFDLQGTTFYADLIPDNGKPGWKFQAGPQVALRFDRSTGVHDPQVRALGKLNTAWEVGGWVGVQRTGVVTSAYDTFSASLTYQADVANAHKSYILSPSVTYATPLSTKAYVSLTAGADYVGRRFGAYYYDVDAAGAAASGLPAYGGADRAGWKDWNTSLILAHSLTGNLTHGLSLFATGGYDRILGAYRRSPIVDMAGNPNQRSGAIGLAFTF